MTDDTRSPGGVVEYRFCAGCGGIKPAHRKNDLIYCKMCGQIIRAVESTDPRQEKLPL